MAKNPSAAPTTSSTQAYIPIAEIRDNVLVLNDGSLRQLIKALPLSIELRSLEEREAVIHQFRSFLNALKFPIQVVVQSRRVDLGQYLQQLRHYAAEERNELLLTQLTDYIEFIERLSEEINIMDRAYYVVVSHSKGFSESTSTKRSLIDRLLGGKKTKETIYTLEQFKELKEQLEEKTMVIIGRLKSLGIETKVLTTEQLIELFYNTYNPEEANTERVSNIEDLTKSVVKNQPAELPNNIKTVINNTKANPLPLPGPPDLQPEKESENPSAATPAPAVTSKKSLAEILHRLGFKGESTAAPTEEEIFQKGVRDVLDIISPSGLAISPNYLQLGNFYARTLFVFTYPRYLFSGWLSPIYSLDTPLDISMFIYPIESATALTQLRRKTTQLQSSLQIEHEKGLVRNPELETAIGDIEELRDTLQKGETRLFQYSLYFTIYARSLDELQRLTKQIESSLGGMLVYTKTALLQMEQGFNTTLPIADNQLDIVRNLDTESLATVFPFSSQDFSHHEGVLYGINLHNSSLVLLNRFHLENANQVVFAKSGAGKSYTVKLELLRSLMMGTEVIVIDPENEYRTLCQAIGGSYIELSLNSTQKINPFELPNFNVDSIDTGEDLLRSNIASLHGLVGLMAGGLSAEEDALLDKALYETYALKDITTDPKTQRNTPPLLTDLINVLANLSGAESLINRLLKFSEGSFSNLFNAPTNIDLVNRATFFSIRNMEDELRPLAMYLVLHYIWSRIKSRLKRRLLVIDEAWWMMRYEDTAKFLNAMTKRARKYYLGVTVVSQDVEDFVENAYGKAIVSNSATQLLMGQSPAAVDKLASIFKLTNGEKQFLLTADVGQGLLVAGVNRAAIQVIASYTEDQLITTNPEQLLMMFGEEATLKKQRRDG